MDAEKSSEQTKVTLLGPLSDHTSIALEPKSEPPLTPSESLSIPRRFLRNARRLIWDDPDKPKEEKWFLFKLDVFLLSSACAGYFCKNLDQANINNAYVSGMKEALHLNGSELTYASNVYLSGYIAGQIPAVILATRVRPSLLIPTVEVLWSILTFCAAAVKNRSQLYAIRFLIGLFESAYFPVVVYMISSWYTKGERGKRVTIFYSTAQLAGMFSGYLQAGAYSGLDGRLGREGWQWLFIICGVISLPIGITGFFFFPDFPETTRAFYITKKEAEWARERLMREGLRPLGASKWNRTKLFRIASQWQFWVLPLGYFFLQGSFPGYQPAFALWLKSRKQSIYEINVWPTGQVAVGVVAQILAGMITDSPWMRGRRWPALIFLQAGTFFSSVVLAVWDVSDNLKFAAFYLLNFSSGAPGLWYSWYPDLIPHDHEMRGFLTAASMVFSSIQSIWFTLVVWRTAQGPRFKAGFIFAASLGVAIILHILLIRFLAARDRRKRAIEQGEDGSTEAVPPSNDNPDITVDVALPKALNGEAIVLHS
ncbi:hypothetical protein AYO21_08893 [Fonsecaea monophora]|uniref:Major facilitator superfamily (MFS) profile domain-containing protein n=1 Tax=Fonsecaea monophora TaxID=254056 RepID=A0A177F0U7_9EURO|nr:hypothetical protein AYO21_08893 [Fonsecaea monophora]KAH0827721.1 Pantothenate transporter liz1 [Fonsecaea pedrosoi]OAG36932.1 hypothetical protein AYO21_08893 [Fonsecaea monophora]